MIDKDGVKPDPLKVLTVKKFPRPRTNKNIKQFLGLAGYYRRFIPNFSKIAKLLTNLLKTKYLFGMKHKIKPLRNYEIYYARSLYYSISTSPSLS